MIGEGSVCCMLSVVKWMKKEEDVGCMLSRGGRGC